MDQNDMQYDDEDEGMIEIDEEQLILLLQQHERIMNGEDPGEPIYDENGQPIQLS